jgi:two-component system response regulator NreC
MSEKTNIIIVDDHKLFRMGIRSMLAEYDDIAVVGEASNGNELLQLLSNDDNLPLQTRPQPDIVLLDVIMPQMGGVETARYLRQNKPNLKILMLSSENSRDLINDLIEMGVNGFITKSACDGGAELAKAIRSVVSGIDYFGDDIVNMLYNVYVAKKEITTPDFTKRERDIIELCRDGLQIKEIADRLNVSPRTIDAHKNSIYRKLGINNTVELVQYALKTGIVKME